MTILQTITIDKESQGRRLDHFLVKSLPELSRSKIQAMIKAGLVAVNGKEAAVHRFLKADDQVEIMAEPLKLSAKAAKKIKTKRKLTDTPATKLDLWKKIRIIDDTPDYLVIEKPSGLLVHPTAKGERDTLIDWAAAKYPEIAKIGDEPGRAGIVHRLDKEVSGLMVIPKTQDAFVYFKKLFKVRQIEKRYAALVYGEVKSDQGEINFPIGRSKDKEGLFAATPENSGVGKPAKTLFWVKDRYKNYTLLEVEILTGRTHQIRVHLKATGHPIVGDELYQGRNRKEKIKAPRIFLHAASLKFDDLAGCRQEYEAPLPKELKEMLEKVS